MYKLVIVLMLIAVKASAVSYYLSSSNMKQVNSDYVLSQKHNDVFYRVDNNKKFFFYLIKLNDLFYETKSFFALPKGISSYKNRFYYGKSNSVINELLINKSFVLIDSSISSISFKNKGRRIVLNKTKHKKVINYFSKFDAKLYRFRGEKFEQIGELPYNYIYENGDFIFMIPKNIDKLPKEMLIPHISKTYSDKEIEFINVPKLKFVNRKYLMNFEKINNDNDKLAIVDSLIKQIKTDEDHNKNLINQFKKIIKTALFIKHSQSDFKNYKYYKKYEEIYDKILNDLVFNAVKNSNYRSLNNFLNDKKQYLENYRKNLLKRSKSEQTSLSEYLFLGISILPGRNLPESATSPGPSKLLGGGAQLEFYHHLNSVIDGIIKFDATYSRWLFNQLYSDYSSDKNFLLSYGISLPFQAPLNQITKIPYANIYFYSSVGYQFLDIVSDSSRSEQHILGGGGFGIDLRVTSLPVILGCDYGYYSNRYGDLKFYLKLPLRRKK